MLHKPIHITLSSTEMFQVASIGVMRRLSAVKHKRQGNFKINQPVDYWAVDIEGAGAELCVAKWLGLYWNAVVNNPEQLAGDVGKYQVRHTQRMDGSLIVRDKDKDDAVFILVVGAYPTYVIIGWTTGGKAKQREYLRGNEYPAYFVPQDALLDPTDLEMCVKMRDE